MIQPNQTLENKYQVDNIFQEIAKYVQRDDSLKGMFINLGQALSNQIIETNRPLEVTVSKDLEPNCSDLLIKQLIDDLLEIVSKQLQSSNKAMLSSIGEEFKSKHIGLVWRDIGFASLSSLFKTHLPKGYELSGCQKYVEKTNIGELTIANEITPCVQGRIPKPVSTSSPLNKHARTRKKTKPNIHVNNPDVQRVRELLAGKKVITFAGNDYKENERFAKYEKVFDIEIRWVKCTKRGSQKTFFNKVLQTNPDLVIIPLHGIGTNQSKELKQVCKRNGIPAVMIHNCGDEKILAQKILEQAGDFLEKSITQGV